MDHAGNDRGYCALHKAGHAHSVEVWLGNELAGGLYGVAVGKCFCGESMFTKVSNASKVALVALVEKLKTQDCLMIDQPGSHRPPGTNGRPRDTQRRIPV